MQEMWVWSLGWEDTLEKKWQPTPGSLPGKSHGQRNLVNYSPWGHKRAGHDLATKQQQQPEWRAAGEGTQEDCSAVWLAVLGFMVRGIVSGESLANYSDSGSFLVVRKLNQDGFQPDGFWEVGRIYGLVPPLSFWLTFPKFFWLVVACLPHIPYQVLQL